MVVQYVLVVLCLDGECDVKKIIGYHGTKERFADSIIRNGFRIANKRDNDNHWLGHGIYFYSDYELAEWWGRTKVNKQNKKYDLDDVPIVIKGVIEGNTVWDLDKPFMLKKFRECQKKLEQEFIKEGIKLDFSKGNSLETIRCFWMDSIKEAHNINVIIYTFTRDNPSYVESKYHANNGEEFSLKNLGLTYHEKQICVTDNQFIVDRCIVNGSVEEFDEVII